MTSSNYFMEHNDENMNCNIQPCKACLFLIIVAEHNSYASKDNDIFLFPSRSKFCRSNHFYKILSLCYTCLPPFAQGVNSPVAGMPYRLSLPVCKLQKYVVE